MLENLYNNGAGAGSAIGNRASMDTRTLAPLAFVMSTSVASFNVCRSCGVNWNEPVIVSMLRSKRHSSMEPNSGDEIPSGLNLRVTATSGTARSASPPPIARYSVRSRSAIAVGPLAPPVTSTPEGRFSIKLLRVPPRVTRETRAVLGTRLVSETRMFPAGVTIIFWGPCSPVTST